MTIPKTEAQATFDQHWADFVRLTKQHGKPDIFTHSDRMMAFCFYTKGYLDATRPLIESQASELAKLGV